MDDGRCGRCVVVVMVWVSDGVVVEFVMPAKQCVTTSTIKATTPIEFNSSTALIPSRTTHPSILTTSLISKPTNLDSTFNFLVPSFNSGLHWQSNWLFAEYPGFLPAVLKQSNDSFLSGLAGELVVLIFVAGLMADSLQSRFRCFKQLVLAWAAHLDILRAVLSFVLFAVVGFLPFGGSRLWFVELFFYFQKVEVDNLKI